MEQITITEDDFECLMRARSLLLASVERSAKDKHVLIELLEVLSQEVAHMKDGKFNPKANHGKFEVYQDVIRYLRSRAMLERACLQKGVPYGD